MPRLQLFTAGLGDEELDSRERIQVLGRQSASKLALYVINLWSRLLFDYLVRMIDGFRRLLEPNPFLKNAVYFKLIDSHGNPAQTDSRRHVAVGQIKAAPSTERNPKAHHTSPPQP